MKTFQLPANSNYGDQPIPVTFPDNWDVHISRIHGYDTPALTEAQIREKLHAAIGTKPISEGAAGKKSAVIIIDDITRPTPCEPIARAVIAELHAAGVPDENIWFIIALDTHGVMYRTEFVRKLGEELVENYEVHNHNLFFNHVFVGNTSNNVPVEINADVMSADYKIAIGTTMAHSYYGFSGGAKCILPGVSSLRTIMRNHSFTTTTEFNMGNPHTLMRSDAEQAAERDRQNIEQEEHHVDGKIYGQRKAQPQKQDPHIRRDLHELHDHHRACKRQRRIPLLPSQQKQHGNQRNQPQLRHIQQRGKDLPRKGGGEVSLDQDIDNSNGCIRKQRAQNGGKNHNARLLSLGVICQFSRNTSQFFTKYSTPE